MTNLLEIKPLIRNFAVENLSDKFNAVYWEGERLKEPKKPYCLLTMLADNNTFRPADYGNTSKKTEIYKQAVVTIAVYVDGLSNFDEQKEFAYSECERLHAMLKRKDIGVSFYRNGVSINSITGIRPLNETVEGGYLYRYEFDVTLGYNETLTYKLPEGQSVDTDISSGIKFVVTAEGDNADVDIE